MTVGAGVFSEPGLLIPFALLQLTVLLLLVRSTDLFERKPLGLVALMGLAGAIVAPMLALLLGPPLEDWLGTGTPKSDAILAAVTEEPSKALCVLAFFVVCVLLADRL